MSTTDAAGLPRSGSINPTFAREVRWPEQLTTNPGLDLHPALSPLGDAIAYVSDRTGAFEIYIRALGGTGTDAPLTSDGGQNVQPAWSPDGSAIAFHSYRRGGIWVMPSRGGIARQVAAGGSNPAWSPDGSRIAFQSDEHADVSPRAWGAQSGSTIWTVSADGRDLRQETHSGQPTGGHAAPTWNSGCSTARRETRNSSRPAADCSRPWLRLTTPPSTWQVARRRLCDCRLMSNRDRFVGGAS